MKELVFLLEEESAAALLKTVLLRFAPPDVVVRYQVFEGKQDLERNITRRLRAWQNPKARFIVVRDLDSTPDCVSLKARLLGLCAASGKGTHALVRLACRELESFYLGDLAAVGRALKLNGLADKQGSRKYRTPDRIESPSEELRQLTRNGYQKVAGSRAIGAELDLDNTRSPSFQHLLSAIHRQLNALN